MKAFLAIRRFLCLALSGLLLAPLSAYGQQAGARPAVPPPAAAFQQELIAVLDLEAVDASKSQASAMTDRLREELLRSGKFILVNRDQMEAVLNEQAFQQTGCTSSECAVQVGKVLGVRKIVSGRVTKIDDQHWLLSASLTDVETARTLRAESVRYEGSFFNLLDTGIAQLATKLAEGAQAVARPAPAVPPAPPPVVVAPPPPPAAPPAQAKQESGRSTWYWWALGAALVLGIVAAAGSGSKKSSSSTPSTAPGSSGTSSACTSNCNTIGFSW